MSEMDGLQAIKEIRRLPEGDTTIIIGLTAFAIEENHKRVLENSGGDYVHKPYNEEDIFLRLEKHLSIQYQFAEGDPISLVGKNDDPLVVRGDS